MYEKAGKSKESLANSIAQSKNSGKAAFPFIDNRPIAIAQRKLQKNTNNYLIVKKKENNTGLPNDLKTGIENLSGYAMDDVKVHYNSNKPAQLQAHAYAQGPHIHLASGQEKHLPHEAWHVVQQKQGRVKPTMQIKGKINVNDDTGLEKEADNFADRFHGNTTGISNSKTLSNSYSKKLNSVSTKPPIQRKITIGNLEASGTNEIPAAWLAGLGAMNDTKKQLLDLFVYEQKNNYFSSIKKLGNFLDRKEKKMPSKDRVLEAHRARHPYKTDALFEGTSLMRGANDGNLSALHRGGLIAKGLVSPSTWLGNYFPPSYHITKIEKLANKAQMKSFNTAKGILGGNERTTYFGHANLAVINAIKKGGHHPAFTPHGGSKGYGALGLGTYSTPILDKAISYAAKGKSRGETGIVLEQKVLIGDHPFRTTNADQFRHDTNDQMMDNNLWSNKHPNYGARTRGAEAGSITTPLGGAPTPTALIGLPSTVSGRSLPRLVGAWALGGASFDSEEILVRNPNQVLPVAAIHFVVG